MNTVRSFKGIAPQLGENVLIDPSAVVIGQVILSDHVSIWPLVVIRGDVNQITIGENTNIQDGSILHVTHRSKEHPVGHPLTIGSDVTIGHKVMLHGCYIGNRVLVGMGTIVLDGVIVDDDVMIGAGSLVPPGKHLTSGYLYLGNPVRQARALTQEEIIGLKKSADNYKKWKQDYIEDTQ